MSQEGGIEELNRRQSVGGISGVIHFLLSRIGFMILVSLASISAVVITAQLATVGPKKAFGALVMLGLAGATLAYKRPKETFLFGWVFSLTYNRQYFVFDGLLGNNGMQGPYLVVADFFLLGLFAVWFYEAAILKRSSAPLGGRLWPWYLPFASACLLSLFVADRMDWTLFEMIRVVKVALILWYARYNLRSREWWLCAAAIGCALTAQSILGVLEVTFRRSGILWMIGMGTAEETAPGFLQAESFFGFRRASATMNHPPNLACYMLLTIPLCAALALTHPKRNWRALSAGATVLGLAGLACTLSRWPWVLMVMQLTVLLFGLVWLRTLPLKWALAIFLLAGLLGASVGLGAADLLYNRLTGDLQASVELRERGNRAALDMWQDANSFLGVGLNNYRVHAVKYEPQSAWVDEYEYVALNLHLRFIAGPLNGFLLVLTETGILGLTAFVIYLVGVAFVGIRAVSGTRGHTQAAALGLLIGFAGVLAQQAIDYSYWVDPLLYTATLVVGMLNCAGNLPDQRTSAGPA